MSATDPAEPRRRELPVVLLVLTVATGVVDAISFLALGGVFTGFQTGNVVLLGFGLAGVEGFAVAPLVVSLIFFVVGATLGAEWAERLPEGHRRWFALALAIEAALIGLGAAVVAGVDASALGAGSQAVERYAAIALLSAAMGVRSATVSQLVVPGVSTNVLTSTITAMAADSGFAGGALRRRGSKLATIAARVLGAAAGALLVEAALLAPFLVAIGLTLFCAVAYVIPVAARRLVRGRRARPRG